jgi:type II pantothenate kinase
LTFDPDVCAPVGVVPFAEEMLRRGSSVILCANSKPVLNDVTYAELVLLLQQVSSSSKTTGIFTLM